MPRERKSISTITKEYSAGLNLKLKKKKMAIKDSIKAAREYGKILEPDSKDPKIVFLERFIGKEKREKRKK